MRLLIHILPLLLLLGNTLTANGQAGTVLPCDTCPKYNPDDVLIADSLYGTVKDGITKADFEIDFTIDDLTEFTYDPATGKVTVTGKGDNEKTDFQVTDPAAGGDETSDPVTRPMSPVTIQDKDGNIYQVTQSTDPDHPEQVVVTPVCKAGDALTTDNFNPKKLDNDKAVVSFRKGPGFYAFDTWQDYYEKAYLIRDKYENLNMIYRVPFKMLPAGKSDVIEATVEIKDKTIDPAKVVFKTPKGVEFKSDYKDGAYTINLVGGQAGDGQEIYATYKSGNKYLNLGKLTVVSYAEQTYKIVIVPVYDTPIDIEAIRKTLKEVYEPVGIHWEVSEEKGYTYNGTNKFFEQKSGLLNSYTPEMREMNADFADNFKGGSIDPHTNYVFILQYSGSAMERDAAGFMPRGGQFGYIFTKDFQTDADVLQTIAHELGHGRLLLKHTFDKDYGIPQSTTDNLMDYAKGETHLAKWQWDVLADPGIAQGVFDRDEDGMSKLIVENPYAVMHYLEEIRCATLSGKDYKYNAQNALIFTAKNVTLCDGNTYPEIWIHVKLKGDVTIKPNKNDINEKPFEIDGFWEINLFQKFDCVLKIKLKGDVTQKDRLLEYLYINGKETVFIDQLSWYFKQPEDKILSYVIGLPDAALEKLNEDQLLRTLRLIASAGDYNSEDLAIRIFKSMQKRKIAEQKEMLVEIRDNGTLKGLVKAIDGNHFIQFVDVLTHMVYNCIPPKEMNYTDALLNNRYIFYNDNYFGPHNDPSIDEKGQVRLKVRKFVWFIGLHDLTCDPYEYVVVHFKNDFKIGNNQFLKKPNDSSLGEYKLPGIFVYLLFNESSNRKWLKTARISFDVALLAVGVGEINAALKVGSVARFMLASSDMIVGLGDIAINTAFENELKSSYPGFVDTWSYISFYYGIARLSQMGIESAFSDFRNTSKRILADPKVSNETKVIVQKMDNEMRKVPQYQEYINEYEKILPELTHFSNNVKNNYPKVFSKFEKMGDVAQARFMEDFGSAGNKLAIFEKDDALIDTWQNVIYLTSKTKDVSFLSWLNKANKSHLPQHLVGEVNSTGKAVGCHLQSAIDGSRVKILANPTPQYHPNGEIFKAKIEINGKSKDALSTFFPASWDQKRVLEEVAYIISIPSNQIGTSGRLFRGISTDGITNIEIRLTGPSGNLTFDTVFPF